MNTYGHATERMQKDATAALCLRRLIRARCYISCYRRESPESETSGLFANKFV